MPHDELQDIKDDIIRIRAQMNNFVLSDRYRFVRDIEFDTNTGTRLGLSDNHKIAFYGVTPTARQATVSQPQNAPATYDQTQIQSIVDAVNTLIVRLQTIGIIK